MPVYKKPNPFPGVEGLPGPLRGLTDLLFPQDGDVSDMAPTPLTMAGKGLKTGYRAVSQKFRPILEELEKIIRTPSVPNLDQMALSTRVTGSKIPPRSPINIPEFAQGLVEFPKSLYPARPQALINKDLAWKGIQALVPEKAPRTSVKPSVPSSRTPNNSVAVRSLEELADVAPKASSSKPAPKILQASGHRNVQSRQANMKRTKLTEADIREIRRKGAGDVNRSQLARDYNTDPSTIKGIIERTSFHWIE